MEYRPTIEEQETLIRISRRDDLAFIETNDTTMMTKIKNLLEAENTQWTIANHEGYGISATCPKELISFRTKKRECNMTDQEKRQRSEFMKSLHKEGKL